MSGCKNKGPHPDESVVKKKKKRKWSRIGGGAGAGPGYFYDCLLLWPLPKCFLLWSCLMLTILSCDFYGSLWSWSCVSFFVLFFICMSPVKDLVEKNSKNANRWKQRLNEKLGQSSQSLNQRASRPSGSSPTSSVYHHKREPGRSWATRREINITGRKSGLYFGNKVTISLKSRCKKKTKFKLKFQDWSITEAKSQCTLAHGWLSQLYSWNFNFNLKLETWNKTS